MKIVKYILIIIILSFVVLLVFQLKTTENIVPGPDPEPTTDIIIDIQQNIENYLRDNISKISPVKAVLGGTWYVVSVLVNLENNSGVVVYEDGHIQETRNFSYTLNTNGEVINLNISNETNPPSNSIACTEEAKLCPDGSSVGRTGPNCEFTACPTTKNQ